jgi:hypothetical protein
VRANASGTVAAEQSGGWRGTKGRCKEGKGAVGRTTRVEKQGRFAGGWCVCFYKGRQNGDMGRWQCVEQVRRTSGCVAFLNHFGAVTCLQAGDDSLLVVCRVAMLDCMRCGVRALYIVFVLRRGAAAQRCRGAADTSFALPESGDTLWCRQ